MKVVILAGGFGTRISEESHLKPKPMIEIGGKPILWHIMKIYSSYGFYDFVICCGYKGFHIKEYFSDYCLHNCDVTFDFARENEMKIHANSTEPWRVTLVDTGLHTMTGGRVKRVEKYLEGEPFMLTYGDGMADINLDKLIEFHQNHGKKATMTMVRPEGRFGIADIENDCVKEFREKAKEDSGWINGGFMLLEPDIFRYIGGDDTIFEKEPLEKLAEEGELMAYKHDGFWHCMDTQRDKMKLEEMWNENQAPWRIW